VPFKQQYLHAKGLLPDPVLQYLKVYCDILRANDRFRCDSQRAMTVADDPVFDAVLCWINPYVSRLAGFDLAPDHSWACISARGEAALQPRDWGEYGLCVTVPIRTSADAAPPILHLKAPDGPEARIEMSEGDGCLIGNEVTCRIDTDSGDGHVQLLLYFIGRQAFS
jgi:hypothetical protein